jgi:curved DNA-binding protein CbpA
MSKPLYELLEVEEDVTDLELKIAYKRRAKETHPDKPDGDAKEFHDVATAYRILRDPDLRAFYDATGRTDTGEFEELAKIHLNVLVSSFETCISELAGSLDQADIMDAMRRNMKDQHVDMRNALAESTSKQAELARLKRRLTVRGERKNAFLASIDVKIAEKEAEIVHNSKGLKVIELCLEELAFYKSPVDMLYAMGYGLNRGADEMAAFGELTGYQR